MNRASASLSDELAFGGVRPLRGRVRVPGDKSISHRALLFAALADGRSTLTHLATGEDVHATNTAVKHLGVKVRSGTAGTVVHGTGPDGWREADAVLDCGNSGTTMRVISGILAGRPMLTMLTGDASLRARPMGRIVEPLRAMGAQIDGRADGTRAPLAIRGGPLHGMRHELPVASAQVKSALLLAGLQADGVTEVVSPAVTRDHTERMLAALGAPIEVDGLLAAGPGRRARVVRARRAGRSLVGRVLRRCRVDHTRLGDRDRRRLAEPDAARVRRRVGPHGCRHRVRAEGRAMRRAGR